MKKLEIGVLGFATIALAFMQLGCGGGGTALVQGNTAIPVGDSVLTLLSPNSLEFQTAATSSSPQGPTSQITSLALSPDGSHLAYTTVFSIGGGPLYVEPISGGGPVKLGAETGITATSWSPNSKYIAFFDQSNSTLYVKDDLNNTLSSTVFPSTSLPSYYLIAWSPDSTQLVFVENHGSGNPYTIATIPAAGGAATTIFTATTSGQISGIGFKDGSTVVFAYNPAAQDDLYSVPIGGGAATNLTNGHAGSPYGVLVHVSTNPSATLFASEDLNTQHEEVISSTGATVNALPYNGSYAFSTAGNLYLTNSTSAGNLYVSAGGTGALTPVISNSGVVKFDAK